MVIDQKIAEAQKRIAAIQKLGKAELADKKKADILKESVLTLKKGKEMGAQMADLNKQIKECKQLQTKIDKFRKEWGTFLKDAADLGTQATKVSPDTKSRDYYFLAVYLSSLGSGDTLDDFP